MLLETSYSSFPEASKVWTSFRNEIPCDVLAAAEIGYFLTGLLLLKKLSQLTKLS